MVIHPLDNVEVREDGHKYAIRPIASGENVVKYGAPIGRATAPIGPGEHVHVHNLRTNLDRGAEYAYRPAFAELERKEAPEIMAYRRADGRIGIRNDIWVIPLVGCVNALAARLAAACGGIALCHPYGCSQTGADHETTCLTLANLVRHPNAGGALVVSLGCENNTMESFAGRLGFDPGTFDAERGTFAPAGGAAVPENVRFLRAQDAGDEYARGVELIRRLEEARPKERTKASAAELVVGLKCGGSDAWSGLTANPLAGRFCDWLVARGGSAVLTETPEMFGAETLLMERCRTREIFGKCVAMIGNFKEYYAAHSMPCWENPSPGNKAGGITTLEEKSLGCVQKGGTAPVEDVIGPCGRVAAAGLTLAEGPGNDMVASTVLAAAGCHAILFTTGRGTPFGSVVPTVKVASNTRLAEAKPGWIDWDAMADGDAGRFAEKVLRVASGEELARNESNGCREIAIFRNGVTL